MKIIEYFKFKHLQKQKDTQFEKSYLTIAKFAMTSLCWFFSSVVVGPIYVAVINPFIIRPKTEFLTNLSCFGGAIIWFILIYILISIFVWRMQKRARI
jgi:hypothetical protein